MKEKSDVTSIAKRLLFCSIPLFMLTACCKGSIDTPQDTKYLEEFHLVNFASQEQTLKEGEMTLYVDYSTCNLLGQNSQFFQDVAAAFYLVSTQIFWCDGIVLGPDISFEQLLQCPTDHRTSLLDKAFCLISQQSLRTGSGQTL